MMVRLPAATIAYLKANGYWGWKCDKVDSTRITRRCHALNFWHDSEVQHCWCCGAPKPKPKGEE